MGMIVPKYMESYIEVLLVDDNPGDTELTAQLLKRNNEFIRVHSVVDGVEAMAFLRCEGKYLAVSSPQPNCDGAENASEGRMSRSCGRQIGLFA
jgi:CheY-like chemotaxis protein